MVLLTGTLVEKNTGKGKLGQTSLQEIVEIHTGLLVLDWYVSVVQYICFGGKKERKQKLYILFFINSITILNIYKLS